MNGKGWTKERKQRLRWWTLVTLSLSLLVVIIDDTIINVAMPSLQRELGATTSALQWIADAYILVFAGLLLTMGTLGDRFGRKRALQLGLLTFAAASVWAASAGSTTELILARGFMGVGGALIMPSTLAVLVDVFPRQERVRAIAIWTGVASLGIPLGPLVGGWLLERYWWGSAFLVNLPIVLLVLVLGRFLVPESRHPAPPRTDWVGAALSTAGVGSLLAGIIEGPDRGWLDPLVLGFFAAAAVILAAYAVFELRSDHPLLDLRLFRRPTFSAGTAAITLAMLALAGLVFNLTQYLQLVRGYSPFQAGLRTIALAVGFGMGGQIAQRARARFGARPAIVAGLVAVSGVLTWFATVGVSTAYWTIGIALGLAGAAISLVLIPSTDLIMAEMPEEQAGIGSAVNDLGRQLGAALGIAVLGSLMNSTFADRVTALPGLPAAAAEVARESLGGALAVAGQLGQPVGGALRGAATSGFMDGFGVAMLAGAGLILVSASVIHRALGTRIVDVDEPAGFEEELELEVA
jgi:EmrB/QacA subfamily drug resistance transporter